MRRFMFDRGAGERDGGFDRLEQDGPQAYVPPTTGTANSKPVYSWDEAAEQLTRESGGWNGVNGQPLTITYAFRSTAPGSMPSDTAGFSRFTPAQISATIEALELWADAANITFNRVGSSPSNPGGYSNNATILFANYSSGQSDASAFAFFPGSRTAGGIAGDIWVNSTLDANAPTFEEVGPRILSHEIGHALGLSHPGDYNGGSPSYAANAIYWQDSNMFTLMSYFGSAECGADRSVFATGPQMHDIAAIQLLYGANMSARAGNSIYGFNSNTGHASMRLTSNADAAVFTIWDAGGIDTLNLSGYSTASQIDLRVESFTSCGPGDVNAVALYNIGIARGVVIERAVGGSGADGIVGNQAANTLTGNAGGDTMSGLTGDDALVGGLGADQLLGGAGADKLNGGAGNDVLTGGAGRDAFIFVEAPSGASSDTIADFSVADDTIRLDNAGFTGFGGTGTLTAGRFHIGTAAHDAGDRIIYDDATGALYFDSDGTGAAAQIKIATLDPGLTMTHADFVVF